MIVDEINDIIKKYSRWLKDKTVVKSIDKEWVAITAPYLDRHNDHLQFYVRKEGNNFVFTDDGYIINDLLDSGCELDAPKRKKILNTTLAGFGVKLEGDALTVKASATHKDFFIKKHNFIQSMLAVNDMYYLASPCVENFFIEDVTHWLDSCDIRYISQVKFTGKSGHDHHFDFAIPKSKKSMQRLVHVMSSPSKSQAHSLIFKWIDTKEARLEDSSLFVLIDDSEKSVSDIITAALKNYDLLPVLWSQKDASTEKLAA